MGIVSVLAAIVVGVLGVLFYAGGSLGGFDGWGAPMDGLRTPLRNIALVIDFCGEPLGAAILIASLVAGCFMLGRRRWAVVLVAGAGVSVGVTTVLKPLVGRTIHGDFLSYPSGHTALATAVALVLALLAVDRFKLGAPRGLLLVLVAAALAGAVMGWTEVALGAHYPSDTVGGFCTALAVVPATAWLVDRAADRL
jgi:undecaprenyl-diphosphatase